MSLPNHVPTALRRLLSQVACGALLLTTLALGCGSGTSSAAPSGESNRFAPLRASLASSGKYYYELRVSEQTITLCHSGVEIARYPTGAVQVGFPRVLWISSGGDEPWVGEIWTGAALDPPLVVERVRIIPGNKATRPTPSAPGVLPPTLEELIAVPSSYRIVFPDTRCIQVHLIGKIPGKVSETDRVDAWWADFQEGIGLKPSHRLRLRVEMEATPGAALFRSFTDSPSFLVLP